MARKIIIVFSGWKTSGKDTACDVIEDIITNDFKYGSQISSITRESFATPMRNIIKEVFGVSYDSVEDKELPLKETKFFFKNNKSYRDLLLLVGEGMKELVNKNVWAYAVERHILEKFKDDSVGDMIYIIPDVRYHQEFKMLNRMKKRGFEVYHYCVFRKEALPEWVNAGLDVTKPEELEIIKTDFECDHSEYEWCIENHKFTGYITNDGTINDLKQEVKSKIVEKIWK